MPQIFRIGPYIVYFWSNESDPLEPVHVHIAEGRATANATKICEEPAVAVATTGVLFAVKLIFCLPQSYLPAYWKYCRSS